MKIHKLDLHCPFSMSYDPISLCLSHPTDLPVQTGIGVHDEISSGAAGIKEKFLHKIVGVENFPTARSVADELGEFLVGLV